MTTMYCTLCTGWAFLLHMYCTSYRSYTVLVKLEMLNFNVSRYSYLIKLLNKEGTVEIENFKCSIWAMGMPLSLSMLTRQWFEHWSVHCSAALVALQTTPAETRWKLNQNSIDLLDRLRQLPWPSTAYRVPRNLDASREDVFEFIAEFVSVHCFHWWTVKTYTMS